MSIVKVLKCAYENCAVVVPLYPLINYEDLCGQLTLRFPKIFFVCYGIVDIENEDNWTWFVEHLARILNYQRKNVTFITDRHHGLLNVIQKYFPTDSHGFYIIYLRENLERQCAGNKFLKDQLCEYFKNCAYACSAEDFDRNIEKMRSIGRDISDSFLDDIPKEYYSIIHFRGNRWGKMSHVTQ
ncbi:hypothetical protein DVH24_029758 [Malus domestica]|uniref:MULE transposase domain-containing protein n=1 Tax=Malus domestica TaxID=3750 RepID=A0A498HZJ7_MALDO|nr:hypothetical protein DVH24_029758 [Malus domestica]